MGLTWLFVVIGVARAGLSCKAKGIIAAIQAD
jgi:hypothetical protein